MSTISPIPSEADLVQRRQRVDESMRWPVLFFFTSSMFWLMTALLAGFVSSIQAFAPDFLAFSSRLGYQNLSRIYDVVLIYGWGFNAVFGISLWLTARMSSVELKNSLFLIIAGHLWNIALSIGLLGILFGGGSGILHWQMPKELWPAMFLPAAVIGGHVFWLFFQRESKGLVYVAQWFILGAWFWLFFAMPSTFILAFSKEGTGIFAALITAWFADGLLYLWFVSTAIAIILYLVPKVSGRALMHEKLLLAAFWGLFGAGTFSGFQRYMGGVATVWMPSLSGAASILLSIPLALVAFVVIRSLSTRWNHVGTSPTLRFAVSAAMALVFFGFFRACLSLPQVAQYTQFSLATPGLAEVAILGVFSMAMFAALYFVTPRTSGCDWRSAYLADKHFWYNVYGLGMLLLVTAVGGLGQGGADQNYQNPEQDWRLFNPYAIGRAICFVFLLASNVVFFTQIVQMWLGLGRRDGEALKLQSSPH